MIVYYTGRSLRNPDNENKWVDRNHSPMSFFITDCSVSGFDKASQNCV